MFLRLRRLALERPDACILPAASLAGLTLWGLVAGVTHHWIPMAIGILGAACAAGALVALAYDDGEEVGQ